MKKLLAILLAVMMLASLSTAAFAEYEGEKLDMAFPETGLTLHMPWECFSNDIGIVNVLFAEEVGYKSGVYMTQLAFERDQDVFDPQGYAPYLTFLCVREDCDQSVLNDPELSEMIPGAEVYEVSTVGAYTHYVSVGANALPDSFTEDEVNLYFQLLEYTDDIIYGADYYEPQDPYADLAGTGISFQTKDFDGNPVSSEELFAANRITMLNIWETGCGPCKGELGELAQIHKRFQEMGCGIVGLLWDSDSQENIDMARQLLQNAGASYPSITCPSNFDELFDLEGFPMSYFIDSQGRILGSPVVGAQVDKYEQALQELLSGGEESDASGYEQPSFMGNVGALNLSGKAAPASMDGTPYRIICVDEDGNPVQGATIQFCSDIQCMMGKTDADGVAEFDEAPGSYMVHLLKVPEGYAKDTTEYEAPAVPGDLTIVVKAG